MVLVDGGKSQVSSCALLSNVTNLYLIYDIKTSIFREAKNFRSTAEEIRLEAMK